MGIRNRPPIQASPPSYFFPSVPSEMKQFFWQSLTVEKLTIRDTLMQFLAGKIKTPIEQEVADMVAEALERDWKTYRTVEIIKNRSQLGWCNFGSRSVQLERFMTPSHKRNG